MFRCIAAEGFLSTGIGESRVLLVAQKYIIQSWLKRVNDKMPLFKFRRSGGGKKTPSKSASMGNLHKSNHFEEEETGLASFYFCFLAGKPVELVQFDRLTKFKLD